MRKILSIMISIILITLPVKADVIGNVLTTDICAYIDYLRVPSYNIDGNTAVILRDLENYGFTIIWDENSRTVNFYRDFSITPEPMIPVHYWLPIGTKIYDVQSTDIKVYYRGILVPSYNINGRTAVRFRDLALIGEPQFNEGTRSADVFCSDVMFFDDEINYIKSYFYRSLDIMAEADLQHQEVVEMLNNNTYDNQKFNNLKNFYDTLSKEVKNYKEYREPYGFEKSSMELWWSLVNQKYATEKLLELASCLQSGTYNPAMMYDYNQFRTDSYNQRHSSLTYLYEDMINLTFFWE